MRRINFGINPRPVFRRGRRGPVRVMVAVAGLSLATAGLVTTGISTASAVVPAGCGPYSASGAPAGYARHDVVNGLYISPGGLGPEFVVGAANVADVIQTSGADDIICGLSGADDIRSSGGVDEIYGGDGEDVIHSGFGNDFLSGGADHDELFGEGDNDVIQGGAANDDGDGGSGNDTCAPNVENPTSC